MPTVPEQIQQYPAITSAMRRLFTVALAIFAWAAIFISTPAAYASDERNDDEHEERHERAYAIGLWGDMPYSSLQASVGVPNLIADMNRQDLAFTAQDGDLKSGSSECTDAVYTQAAKYFQSLRAPAAFTPGDNDWTDCDRTAGYNSLAQLDKERKLFFSTPFTLGQTKLHQEVQTDPLCLVQRRFSTQGTGPLIPRQSGSVCTS